MKVRYDEIGISDMNIDGELGKKESRQTTDREEADKTKRVQHWGLKSDRAFVQRRRPVKDLYPGRNRD